MNDADGFYAAIRERPSDNLPRLVFADWLEENGEVERAEFLRLSCQLAELSQSPDSSVYEARLERWKELASQHRFAWFGTLTNLFRPTMIDRGLLTEVTGPVDAFLIASDELDQKAKALRKITVRNVLGDLGIIVTLPVTQRVQELQLNRVSPRSMQGYFSTIELPNLERLIIETENVRNATEAIRYLHWPVLRRVPWLRFILRFQTDFDSMRQAVDYETDQCLDWLRHLQGISLRSLDLSVVNVPVARALAHWPGLAQLEELDLHGFGPIDAALRLLWQSHNLPKLRRLNLRDNWLIDSIPTLLEYPHLGELHELDISHCRIGNAGVVAILECERLKPDLRLKLGGNAFSGHLVPALRERFSQIEF